MREGGGEDRCGGRGAGIKVGESQTRHKLYSVTQEHDKERSKNVYFASFFVKLQCSIYDLKIKVLTFLYLLICYICSRSYVPQGIKMQNKC